jgi:adenine phosphoribosyltransferase
MDKEDMNRLIVSLENAPIIRKGEYRYFVHPLSDGIPAVEPDLLETVSVLMLKILPEKENYDLLLTPEAMGIPLTTSLSRITSKPFSIARKRRYGLDGEIAVNQITGYSMAEFHLNLPKGPGSIIIVDDVLSTGGTFRSLVQGISRTEWKVSGAVVIFNKMGAQEVSSLEKELNIEIKALLDVIETDDGFTAKGP